MKIVFMGTPDFAVPTLEALKEEGYSIDLVITQKDRRRGRGKKVQYTPIKEKALELDLEVYQPENVNSQESIDKLREIKPDFIVVVAYGQILKEEILEIPKYMCVNVHASLLPKYRGAAPINWAIINGEKETGITIMEMEKGLDTGDMLLWKSIPITSEDEAPSIHDKLSELGGSLIVEALEGIKEGKINKLKQDDSLSSYASMLSKERGKINWKDSGEKINNLVRGLKPWPSAYTDYKGESVKIHKLEVLDKKKDGKEGEIIRVDEEGVFVNASDKTVLIKELQFPGKRKMLVKDYIRGNDIEVGIILA